MKKSLPRYSVKQPSTKKNVTFRPFTVKEEKALIIANQTGSYEDFLVTLANIIDNCFDLKTDAKNLSIFDVEYFFLKLRSKSVGEILEPIITCPVTNEKIKLQINLDNIEPIYDSTHSNVVNIDNAILVKLKYPSLNHLIEKENSKADYFEMIIDCIESIETKNEIIEADSVSRENLKEFIELLTSDQYKKIISFFKTSPKLEYEAIYITSDMVERKIILRGLRDFFQ
jgi:hypothetical protein